MKAVPAITAPKKRANKIKEVVQVVGEILN